MSWLATMNSTMFILMWALIFILIVGGFLFLFYWFFMFNVNVRLRYKTNTHDQTKNTKGRYLTDRDGVEKLIVRLGLFKRKAMILPPPNAISLTTKGTHDLEIEVSQHGSWRYMTRETSDPVFKPYDTNDRVFHINEHDKRLERKSNKTWMQIVADAVPFIALVIILALVIFGWGEIVEPFDKIGQTQKAITSEQKEITKLLKEIIKQEQIIRGEEAPLKVVTPAPVNQTPPE